jgi:DNA-binding MarR family transcriptional regulator
MRYQLLKELIPYIEAFEAEQKTEDSDMQSFIRWLIVQENLKKFSAEKDDLKKEQPSKIYQSPSIGPQGDDRAQVTQLLALMYKYLKFYLKKGFEHSPFAGPDDFGFLATLMMEGSMHKNSLIEKNTLEFSSGMEVIRRLERNHLIKSTVDPEDRRAKLVEVTEEGVGVFMNILPTMNKIGTIATANLNEEERAQLLALLRKLNHFHNPIFHEAKKESVEEIMQQFISASL